VIVTPTSTPTPLYTPTITNTPTVTPTITSTPNKLTMDKKPGIYLVNVDIAPGVWRSQGVGDNCYWGISNKTGKTTKNHFGKAGGTMYVSASDYQVSMEDECGMWVYLGE
jgi:hypothetical protein